MIEEEKKVRKKNDMVLRKMILMRGKKNEKIIDMEGGIMRRNEVKVGKGRRRSRRGVRKFRSGSRGDFKKVDVDMELLRKEMRKINVKEMKNLSEKMVNMKRKVGIEMKKGK